VLPAAACGQARPHRMGPGEIPVRVHGRGRDGEAALRPVLHQTPVGLLRPDHRARYRQGDPLRKGRQVTSGTDQAETIWQSDDRQLVTVARNMTTRYLAIGTDALIGLVLLPFNVHHLGPAAYGLWMLTASMTTYFSVLDLGFGGSIVKFVAHYRAKRDVRGLNEIASTLFVIFSVVGVVAYAMFVLVALNIGRFFALTPDQVSTGRSLMLL